MPAALSGELPDGAEKAPNLEARFLPQCPCILWAVADCNRAEQAIATACVELGILHSPGPMIAQGLLSGGETCFAVLMPDVARSIDVESCFPRARLQVLSVAYEYCMRTSHTMLLAACKLAVADRLPTEMLWNLLALAANDAAVGQTRHRSVTLITPRPPQPFHHGTYPYSVNDLHSRSWCGGPQGFWDEIKCVITAQGSFTILQW